MSIHQVENPQKYQKGYTPPKTPLDRLNEAFKTANERGWTAPLIKDLLAEFEAEWTWTGITHVPNGQEGVIRAMFKRHPSWPGVKATYKAGLSKNGIDYKLLCKACDHVGEKPPNQCDTEGRKRLFRMVAPLTCFGAVPENPLRSRMAVLSGKVTANKVP